MKPVQKYSLVSYFVHFPGCTPFFFKSIAGAIVFYCFFSGFERIRVRVFRKIPHQKYLNFRMAIRYLYDI